MWYEATVKIALLGGLGVLCGCALFGALACEPSAKERLADSGARDAATPLFQKAEERRPAGCKRSGAIDTLENDATCLVDAVDPEEVDASLKSVTVALEGDTDHTVPNGVVTLRVVVSHTAKEPQPIYFEVEEGPKPHMDALGRMEPGGPDSGIVRWLKFEIKTLNAYERPVDFLKTPKSTATERRIYRVIVPPRAKLVRTLQWFAMWFPPEPKPDPDASVHIEYKPVPLKLPEGKYTVRVNVPLFRAEPAQRVAETQLRVAN